MGTFLVVVLAYGLAFYPMVALTLEAWQRHLSKFRYVRDENHLFYGVLLVLIAFLFALIGVAMLLAVLPIGRVIALLLASLLIFTGLYMYAKRKKRPRNRRYRTAMLLCVVVGVFILYLLL